MSRVIWKYELSEITPQVLELPEGFTILNIQMQRGKPCMWVDVAPDAPKVLKGFYILGTGQPLPHDSGLYIGTYQEHDGLLVWHVFMRGDA